MTVPAQIITEDDLATHLRQHFPDGLERQAATAATAAGQSVVLSYLRRPNLDGIPEHAQYALRLVMLRQAAQIFRTPGNEQTSFSNGEVSIGLNPRLLTPDEKAVLRQYRRLRATTAEPTTADLSALTGADTYADDLEPGSWHTLAV
jgi:hypothetical protein